MQKPAMTKTRFTTAVSAYKKQLEAGEIQVAYAGLVKFVMALRTRFSRSLSGKFSVSGVFQGYMDYTYFYFSNDFCRERKLKFGLVLNHEELRFEIWLLGQTKDIQQRYWNLLKGSDWIPHVEMPRYAIFEHVLISSPDFDNLDALSKKIEAGVIKATDKILDSLNRIERNRLAN